MNELNEITLYDHLMTLCAVEIIYNQSYQCGFCITKMAEVVREQQKNCTGIAKVARKRVLDIFTFTHCPGNFYSPAYGNLVDIHRQFRKGILANTGGLMDQPSKYIDLMNLVETLISQKEIEAMKKSVKNGKQSGKR